MLAPGSETAVTEGRAPRAAAFLVSDEARFITAEHLSIDGGAQYF